MSNEDANRPRWDGRSSSHLEDWQVSFVHRSTSTGFAIKHSLIAPRARLGRPAGRVWFALFDADRPRQGVAINKGVPIEEYHADPHPFRVLLGDCELRHDGLRGEITSDAHSASWDLRFEPAREPYHYLPDLAHERALTSLRAVAPSPLLHVSGQVEVDGRSFELAEEPGCQTHRWGDKHLPSWVTATCGAFREDATASLQLLSFRWKPRRIASPRLTTVALFLGGELYELRGVAESLIAGGRWREGAYRFHAAGRHVKLEGELRARPEELVRSELRDPDGEMAYAHATGVADALVTVWTRRTLVSRFRQLGRLTGRSTAYFEYGNRAPDSMVDRRHEAVDFAPGSPLGRARGFVPPRWR